MFPDSSKFLKYPQMLEERKRLNEFIGLNHQDGKPVD
jgi:hypothetical protein